MLNAWYMAKCIYPNELLEVSIRDKGNELFTQYYGVPIYDKLNDEWGAYQQLNYQSAEGDKTEWKSLNE